MAYMIDAHSDQDKIYRNEPALEKIVIFKMRKDILQNCIRNYPMKLFWSPSFGMGLYLLQVFVCPTSEGANAQARLGVRYSPMR